MDAVGITIGCGWIFTGLLCALLSVPLIRGRVKPNPIYGVRFRQSFQSDEAWFAINRFGGRQLAMWSMPLVLVGVVALFLPLRSHESLALVLGFAPLVFVLIPTVITWRFARQFDPKKQ